MPRVLWIHAAADPVGSGELRRLGIPALATDEAAWTSDFVSMAAAAQAATPDVVVVPLDAAAALPALVCNPAPRVLIEVDLRQQRLRVDASSILAGLSNRIAGVVARGTEEASWASRVLQEAAPVWVVPDAAARPVELQAAALHFGLSTGREPPPALDGAGWRLWFAEPSDFVDEAEVRELSVAWADEAADRLIVAPDFVRSWLRQVGIAAPSLRWSPATLQAAFSGASRCEFHGPQTQCQVRRRMTALRSGAAAPPPAKAAGSSFEPAQIGAAFESILQEVSAPARRKGRTDLRLRIMVFIDLIQDLDLLLPLLDELAANPEVETTVVATDWVDARSPRLAKELAIRGLRAEICVRRDMVGGQTPAVQGFDAVVAAAVSSLSAHAPSHRLLERARQAGVPTFAMQHGVENVGLHPAPEEDEATIVADHLFVWFPPERTPAQVSAALRPRLVHVGRSPPRKPELSSVSAAFSAFDRVVAVFENLHWSRYDPAWRLRFLTDCTEFAASHPDTAVILKPHHAGLWSAKNRHLVPQWPSNLILADPTDAFWEPYTANALVQLADAVFTTPSTVALDAAQAGVPVAVAAYGLDLPLYAPLPLLQQAEDWSAFVGNLGTAEDARRRATFLNRTAAGDDPARKAAEWIAAVAAERRSFRSGAAVAGRARA